MKAIVFEWGHSQYNITDVKVVVDDVNYIETKDGFTYLYRKKSKIVAGCYTLDVRGVFANSDVKKIILEDD